MAEGLFAPDSILRKLSRETVGLLGGGRALLLQLAHPLIAAGVGDHSRFQDNPLSRLTATIDTLQGIIFADGPEVQRRIMDRFHVVHAAVRGRLQYETGRFPAGTSYSARDPELKLWVHATLVDTTLITYERFVAPLSPVARGLFYEDTKRLARLYGIPVALTPPTLAAFDEYMAGMMAGDILAVTERTRLLALSTVIAPDVPFAARTSARLVRFVTLGLLPEPVRQAYGFIWNRRREVALNELCRVSRLLMPVLPGWLRWMPILRPNGFVGWTLGRKVRTAGARDFVE